MENIKNRPLTDVEKSVIRNCIFVADGAVLDAADENSIRTPADRTRVAVTAAIKAGILNGVLRTTDKAESGYWFQLNFDDDEDGPNLDDRIGDSNE